MINVSINGQPIENNSEYILYWVDFIEKAKTYYIVSPDGKHYVKYPKYLNIEVTSSSIDTIKTTYNNGIPSNKNLNSSKLPVTITGLDFLGKEESERLNDNNEWKIEFDDEILSDKLKGIEGDNKWKVTITNSYEIFTFYFVGHLKTSTIKTNILELVNDEDDDKFNPTKEFNLGTNDKLDKDTVHFLYEENIVFPYFSSFFLNSVRVETTYFDPDDLNNVITRYYSVPIQITTNIPSSISDTLSFNLSDNGIVQSDGKDFYYEVKCIENNVNHNAQAKSISLTIQQTDGSDEKYEFQIIQDGEQTLISEEIGNDKNIAEQIFTSYMMYDMHCYIDSYLMSNEIKDKNLIPAYTTKLDLTLANPAQIEQLFNFVPNPKDFEYTADDWTYFYTYNPQLVPNREDPNSYKAFTIRDLTVVAYPSYYGVLNEKDKEKYNLSSYQVPLKLEFNSYKYYVESDKTTYLTKIKQRIDEKAVDGDNTYYDIDIYVYPEAWTNQSYGFCGSPYHYKSPEDFFTSIKDKTQLKSSLTGSNKDSSYVWTNQESDCSGMFIQSTSSTKLTKDFPKWYTNKYIKKFLTAYTPLRLCIPIEWNHKMLYTKALDYYNKHYVESSKGYVGPEEHNGIAIKPENKGINNSLMPESAQKAIEEEKKKEEKENLKNPENKENSKNSTNNVNNDLGVQDMPISSSTQLKMSISGLNADEITGLTDINNCVAECNTDKGITSLSVNIKVPKKLKDKLQKAEIGEDKEYKTEDDLPEYKIATITVYGMYDEDESNTFFAGGKPSGNKVTSIIEGTNGVKFDVYLIKKSSSISGSYSFNDLSISLNIS